MRIAKTLLVLAALGLAGALVAPRAPVGAGAWPATALQPASALAADGHAGHGGGAPAAAMSPAPAAPQPNEEPPTIEIPPERQQMIGVKTALVTRRVMERTIRTVGRVEVDEQRQVAVTTKFEGWVEKLHADATGKFVRKGEPLAEIYSPELFATQQEFLNLLRWKKDPGGAASSWDAMLGRDRDAILEAARERLRLWDITDAQVRAIETSGKPIRTLTLFSPISGYVIQKMVVQGMRIMPGEKLFDLADLSTVWVIADVYEYELPLIRPGLTARMRLSYFPDKEFTSKVDYVYPTLSGESRTAQGAAGHPEPRRAPQAADVLQHRAHDQARGAAHGARPGRDRHGDPQDRLRGPGRRAVRAARSRDRPGDRTVCRNPAGREGRRAGGLLGELPDRFGGPAEGGRPPAAQVTLTGPDPP